MINLVIDAGNTRIKVALFEGEKLLQTAIWDQQMFEQNIQLWVQDKQITKAILSDVSGLWETKIKSLCSGFPVLVLGSELKLPFVNLYESPQTLGSDRIALVAAALHFFSGSNCLVIDAGTCVTYDVLNASLEYLGGNISPGLQMRLRAMHEQTGKLPLPQWQQPVDLLGKNTKDCLLTGAYFGLAGEINYFIEHYQLEYPDLKVLLTGGDAEVLAKSIKTSIFAQEHLLLYGLNKILNHNAA